MSRQTRHIICKTQETYLEKMIEHKAPCNKFDVEVCVDRHDTPDPAGLCDGVDYCKSLQIRLEDDGTVACFWNEFEHGSSMECVYDVPYEEFFKFMLPALRRLKKKYAPVETG